jgi:site-specific DNA recombinase
LPYLKAKARQIPLLYTYTVNEDIERKHPMYSEKVMDHFQHPRNVGEIENASGMGTVGNAKCGDIMRIYLDIDDNQIIQDVKFKTFGCGAAVATSSMATEMVKGKTIQEAMEVTNKAVMEALDGLPPVKVHCSLLAEEAIHAALWDYAQKNDMIVSGDFIFTESVSGRHAQKRPEFQKMIALAKQPSHPIDVILVWKFSRFARNQEESIVYKSMLKKDNVDVISVSEPLIEGPFGSLIERIIEWMDEYYSIRLSGEVLRGMKEKALQKGYQTSPCLGYTAVGHGKPYIINEAEYAIVSYIMDLYDNQNLDETAIARRCNDLGYRTKRGKLFERRSVDRILGNPFYCGTVVWNGVEFEGNHEVRLSRERYEKRQKLITSRKRPVKARNVSACKHWLSGLLKCSVCGATLSYTGNNKCPYFQCWKYAKGFHKTSVALSVKKAEEAVISYFDQILDGAEFTYVCKKKKTDHSLQIEQLQREIGKLTMRESRIKEAYEAGVDTLEEYKNNKDRLVSDRLELTAALSQLLQEEQAEQTDAEEILKEIRSVADVLKNPDVGYEAKGNLIRSVVEQIIYDKESGKMSFDIIIS